MSDPRHPGYRWLTPNLVVVDARKSIQFYQDVFDFASGYIGEDNGEIVHVTMQYHDKNIIMFTPEGKFGAGDAPITSNIDLPTNLYLYVDDVDATVEKVKAAGGKVLMPAEDSFWGDRFALVTDINGYKWGLGKYLETE